MIILGYTLYLYLVILKIKKEDAKVYHKLNFKNLYKKYY